MNKILSGLRVDVNLEGRAFRLSGDQPSVEDSISGWWFGTLFIFPYIGNVIIPIDFPIFQRGGPNHQPDMFGIPSSQLVVDGSVSAEEIWFKPQVAAGVQTDFHQSRLDSTSLNMVQEMVMLRWLQGRDAAGSLLNQPNMGLKFPANQL